MGKGKKPVTGARHVTLNRNADTGAAKKATDIFDELDKKLPWANLRISSQQTSQEGSLTKNEDSEAIIRREQER